MGRGVEGWGWRGGDRNSSGSRSGNRRGFWGVQYWAIHGWRSGSGRRTGDDYGSDDPEDTFPDVFGGFEGVATSSVESSNYTGTDDQANDDTTCNSSPDLADELLVNSSVMFRTESLLEKGEED